MKVKTFILSLSVSLFFSIPANSTLIDRGGGLIYDTILNVTWLQDVNYAKTSGYDSDGKMTWEESMTWVQNLDYYDHIRNVNWTDWRLPQTLPLNGSNYNLNFSLDGSSDIAWNISAPGSLYSGNTSSELAYMYYNNLGNTAAYDLNGKWNSQWPGPQQISPFININLSRYEEYDFWSGSTFNSETVWRFNYGSQGIAILDERPSYAWAVRAGDVGNAAPVPEPATMILFGTGLAGLAAARRRKKAC